MEALIFNIILTVLIGLIIVFDVWKYIIPNWLNLVIILLYPIAAFMMPDKIDWLNGLLTGVTVFVVGFIAYQFKVMGGGDIKCFTVCALWTGYPLFIEFFAIAAIAGGILAIVLLISRPIIFNFAAKYGKIDKIPRLFQKGSPVPFGVAIAASMIFLIWQGAVIPA